MSKYNYFSDYDSKAEYIDARIWKGIYAVYQQFLDENYFIKSFPKKHWNAIRGTDENKLFKKMKAHIPEVTTLDKIFKSIEQIINNEEEDTFSDTKIVYKLQPIMDFIIFLYEHISNHTQYIDETTKPPTTYYSILDSDISKIQEKFREEINIIFSRNKLNFTLKDDGKIVRTLSPFFEEKFDINFSEKNTILNEHLNIAYTKFKSTNFSDRKLAIRELWDAFENIIGSKTKIELPILIENVIKKDKKLTDFSCFSDAEKESLKLKMIGNKVNIRHSNDKQIPLDDSAYLDYLFYRMSATIHLLLTGLNKKAQFDSKK